jgi:hypothetical protein
MNDEDDDERQSESEVAYSISAPYFKRAEVAGTGDVCGIGQQKGEKVKR